MTRFWRTVLTTCSVMAVLGGAAAPAEAHGYHGYGPYRYDYRFDYWHGYPYPYYDYGPSYRFSYGIGYGHHRHHYGGHGTSFSLFYSAPLYLHQRPVAVTEPQPIAPAPAEPACLQTREYQTEVMIGEKAVPAYGMACLQADGTWKVIGGPTAEE